MIMTLKLLEVRNTRMPRTKDFKIRRKTTKIQSSLNLFDFEDRRNFSLFNEKTFATEDKPTVSKRKKSSTKDKTEEEKDLTKVENGTNNLETTNIGTTTMREEEFQEKLKSEESTLQDTSGLTTINSFKTTKSKKGDKRIKKRAVTDKQKSAKKTRLKNKFLGAITLSHFLAEARIPVAIVNTIRTAKLELIDLDRYQQKLIVEMTEKYSKEELTIMLLLTPNNADELNFLKNVFLRKQYIDTLFRNIDFRIIS